MKYVAPIMNYSIMPVIRSGEGCYVYDTEGKRYLDINCGQFSAIFGHVAQPVKEVLMHSEHSLIHLNTNLISEDFLVACEELHKRMPGMNSRIAFFSTGGEANECALRYAKHLSGNKPGVISFTEGYHGLTHGTEGYSISRQWVKPPLAHSFTVTAPPVTTENGFDYEPYIEQFRKMAMENKDVVAAALFEPIVSVGGLFYPQKEYWKEIRRICDETGIFLIFDECQSGFARTGNWFYYHELECVPDMLVCAKAMGLGFPVSMLAFNGNKFFDDFKMHHFSSHQNEPFSAQLVLQGIKTIDTEQLLPKIKQKGSYLVRQLQSLAEQFDILEHPRGRGLLCGISLKRYQLSKSELQRREEKIGQIAMKHGLLLQFSSGGVAIRILPAYTITIDEIDDFIRRMENTFIEFQKGE